MEGTQTCRDSMDPSADIIARYQEELQGTLCKQIHAKIYGRAFDMADKDDYQAFLAAEVAAKKIIELQQSKDTKT